MRAVALDARRTRAIGGGRGAVVAAVAGGLVGAGLAGGAGAGTATGRSLGADRRRGGAPEAWGAGACRARRVGARASRSLAAAERRGSAGAARPERQGLPEPASARGRAWRRAAALAAASRAAAASAAGAGLGGPPLGRLALLLFASGFDGALAGHHLALPTGRRAATAGARDDCEEDAAGVALTALLGRGRRSEIARPAALCGRTRLVSTTTVLVRPWLKLCFTAPALTEP